MGPSKRWLLALLVAGGAVGAAAWLGSPPRVPWPPVEAPNVVVVVGCTVRRDQTTPYGGPDGTTPFLASLAAGGARFEDALATSTWTREAVAGLLTGAPAASWGMPDPRVGESPRALAEEATTLAERFRAAGWLTLGVNANPNLNAEYGMSQGFETYLGAASAGFVRKRLRRRGSHVAADALALLDARIDEEARARPFYLQLVMIDVHTPRAPKRAEVGRFEDPDVPEQVREYRALLRRLDEAIADLDRGLTRRGHGPDNTLFVFVADHGEGLSFPEHHREGHGKRMYPSTVSIPWIVRGPGVGQGVVRGLASGEDFAPTILGLAGLAADPALPGRDWSGLVRGGGRTDRRRAFSLSMFQGADIASVWTDERQCQLDFGSLGSDPPMLDGCFDRVSDPWFAVSKDDPALPQELRRWREERLREGAGREVRDGVPAAGTTEALEALGYLE